MNNLQSHSANHKTTTNKNISKVRLEAQRERERIAKKRKKYNDRLNEALEQTFPASDSIARY